MSKTHPSQSSKATNQQTAENEQLSVGFWRNELSRRMSGFDSMATLTESLAKLDAEFTGMKGYFQVISANRGRASLRVTAKIVRLIDQLRPPDKPTPKDRLNRQGLTRKRT